MRRSIFCLIALLIFVLSLPMLAPAAQFSALGPRSLGMGGAGVAAVNDSTAVYWNPAALAAFRRVDIRTPVTVAVRDHIELADTMDRINEIDSLVQLNDPAAIDETIRLLNEINKPGSGADLDSVGGALVTIPIGGPVLSISAIGFIYAGIYPTIDTVNLDPNPLSGTFVGGNNSAVTGIGMATVEPTASLSLPIGSMIFLGANAKMISADTYIHSDLIKSNTFDTFGDQLDASKTSSDATAFDAGILVKPMEGLAFGLVGRNLNGPSFPVQGQVAVSSGGVVSTQFLSGEIKLKPQLRAGVAWNPLKTLTIAADYDLTKNETLLPGYEDQTFAVGLEKSFLAEHLNLRVGAYQNLAESDANIVYTAGLGTRILAFRLDVAGAYDFDEKELQASIAMALRF